MTSLALPAFLMGLFGGAHCVVMCGGVSTLLCAGGQKPSRFSLTYNAGRVASYALFGLAAGVIGGVPFGLPLDVIRFAFRALAAVCLLSVGLHLAGFPSFVRSLESLGAPLWRRLGPTLRRLLPLRSPWQAFAAGSLWAFMPCGLLYGALALAAGAGSPVGGATTMASFGLGTLPIMLSVGVMGRWIAVASARPWVRRLAGLVVLGFGLWTTSGLAGQVGLTSHAHACCPRR